MGIAYDPPTDWAKVRLELRLVAYWGIVAAIPAGVAYLLFGITGIFVVLWIVTLIASYKAGERNEKSRYPWTLIDGWKWRELNGDEKLRAIRACFGGREIAVGAWEMAQKVAEDQIMELAAFRGKHLNALSWPWFGLHARAASSAAGFVSSPGSLLWYSELLDEFFEKPEGRFIPVLLVITSLSPTPDAMEATKSFSNE
jgi:hypothetical protein